MIIKRLRLHNFKKFRDETIEFGPGLNVIKGSNEAGKSTLHAALRMAFFEKPTATSQEVKRAKSWRAEEMFAIGMDVAADDGEFRLGKDFAARKASLAGGDTSEPVTDPDSVQKRLSSWLGCPNEKFFRSTVCVDQDEVAGWDAGEMARHLQKVVAGGDVAAREAIKKLGSALQKLRVGLDRPAVNPGRIKQTRDRLKELKETRAKVAGQVAGVVEAKRTATECRDRLEGIADDLKTKTELVEKNRKQRELASEIDALQTDFAGRRRAKELNDEIEELARREESFGALGPDERRAASLAEQSARLDEKRQILARMRSEAAEAPRPARPSILIPAMGAIILVAGIAAGFTMTPGMYVVALAGAAILIYGLTMYAATSRASVPTDTSQTTTLQREVEEDEAALATSLAEVGVASPEEATKRLAELNDVRANREQAQGELKGVTGGKSWEEFDEQTRGLAPDIERKKEVADSLAPSVLDPLEYERLQSEVEKLAAGQQECEKRMAQANYAIEHTDVDPDELARIDDEAAELRQTAELLARRQRVYEAAIEGIEQAERETMEKATDALQETVGARVSQMTNGRYSEVVVDEGDLSMSVRSDEKDDWVSVDDDLSRATRDQFYLAARLGLIGQLCGEAEPPLLLDDPFVTFDADRLERTMALLKEMAEERQVLLFTCHEEYGRFADHVIDLGALERK